MAYGLTQSMHVETASSEYATVTSHTFGIAQLATISIEGWFKFDSLPATGTIYGICTVGWTNQGVHLWYENVGGVYYLRFYQHTWGTETRLASYTITLNTGQWYHIACTKNGNSGASNGILYLDGVQVATATMNLTGGAGKAVNSLIGGTYNNGSFMYYSTGNMSLFRVWSTVRTQAQIADNKCTVFGAAESGMRAEYSLDNVYTDASGNAYTLTAVNTPTFEAETPSTCSSAINSGFLAFM